MSTDDPIDEQHYEKFSQTELHTLQQRLLKDLQALDIIHDFGVVAVALSGGVDSVLLLHLVIQALGPSRVVALHVNHQTRQESYEDEGWCRDLCDTLSIPFLPLTIEKPTQNFQAEARRRRYAALRRGMLHLGAQTLLTGHHANDRLETSLDRMTRGSNSSGMTQLRRYTILWGTHLCRPLLNMLKCEIMALAHFMHLTWRVDSSNQNLSYRRNEIRHRVLPLLAGDRGVTPILRTLDHLEEDAHLIEEATDHLLMTAHVGYFDQQAHRLDRGWLDRLSKRMKGRLLYRFFQKLRLYPTHHHIEKIFKLSEGCKEMKVVEIPGADVVISPNYYTVERHPIRPRRLYEIEISATSLHSGELLLLWFGQEVRLQLLEVGEPATGNVIYLPQAFLQQHLRLTLNGFQGGVMCDGVRVAEALREGGISVEDRWRSGCFYLEGKEGSICVGILGTRYPTPRNHDPNTTSDPHVRIRVH